MMTDQSGIAKIIRPKVISTHSPIKGDKKPIPTTMITYRLQETIIGKAVRKYRFWMWETSSDKSPKMSPSWYLLLKKTASPSKESYSFLRKAEVIFKTQLWLTSRST